MKNELKNGVWTLSVHTRLGDTLKVQVGATCLQGTVVALSLRGATIADYEPENALQSMFVKWQNVTELVEPEPATPPPSAKNPLIMGNYPEGSYDEKVPILS